MIHLLCLVGLLALLILAATTDLRERRIPNWLTAAVAALYPIHLALSPDAHDWWGALLVATLALGLGALLFARDLMGGGDVKLIAALALWAGPELIMTFALATSLAGGLLGLLALRCQRWSGMIQARLAGLGWVGAGVGDRRPASGDAASADAAPPAPHPVTLPYGVAIALGGAVIVVELIKL